MRLIKFALCLAFLVSGQPQLSAQTLPDWSQAMAPKDVRSLRSEINRLAAQNSLNRTMVYRAIALLNLDTNSSQGDVVKAIRARVEGLSDARRRVASLEQEILLLREGPARVDMERDISLARESFERGDLAGADQALATLVKKRRSESDQFLEAAIQAYLAQIELYSSRGLLSSQACELLKKEADRDDSLLLRIRSNEQVDFLVNRLLLHRHLRFATGRKDCTLELSKAVNRDVLYRQGKHLEYLWLYDYDFDDNTVDATERLFGEIAPASEGRMSVDIVSEELRDFLNLQASKGTIRFEALIRESDGFQCVSYRLRYSRFVRLLRELGLSYGDLSTFENGLQLLYAFRKYEYDALAKLVVDNRSTAVRLSEIGNLEVMDYMGSASSVLTDRCARKPISYKPLSLLPRSALDPPTKSP